MSAEQSRADSDYDSILGAVMETARGRWFLHEYVRRNRNAETSTLLAAIDRIELLMKSRDAEPPLAISPAAMSVEFAATLQHFRGIAENLIECGAPTYLCNDLRRRIEELEQAFAKTPGTEISVPAAAPETMTDASTAIVAAASPHDPFADIMALSPEERIALFT